MSEEDENVTNFLAEFRDPTTKKFKSVTAEQFLKCWQHFDKDGSGYLEGDELDDFLREMVQSVTCEGTSNRVLSESALAVLKDDLLLAYDDNDDGKIDMIEMTSILPTEETFSAIFNQENQLPTSVEFIRMWRKYDEDNNGYLEENELKLFLDELFRKRNIDLTEEKLSNYAVTILELFDTDHDGKLKISEMSRLLPVKQNFLKRPLFKSSQNLTNGDIDRAFLNYDKDKSGYLEGDELEGFLKDLMEIIDHDYDTDTLCNMKEAIMSEWDADGDGKLGREELKTIILHSVSSYQPDEQSDEDFSE